MKLRAKWRKVRAMKNRGKKGISSRFLGRIK